MTPEQADEILPDTDEELFPIFDSITQCDEHRQDFWKSTIESRGNDDIYLITAAEHYTKCMKEQP